MAGRLDHESRFTIGRFFLKLTVSALLSSFGRNGLGVHFSMSLWLTIYALVALTFALWRRERFRTDGFNHWNEALWLTTSGLALMMFFKFHP